MNKAILFLISAKLNRVLKKLIKAITISLFSFCIGVVHYKHIMETWKWDVEITVSRSFQHGIQVVRLYQNTAPSGNPSYVILITLLYKLKESQNCGNFRSKTTKEGPMTL